MTIDKTDALNKIREAVGLIQVKLKDDSLTAQDKNVLSDTLDNLLDQQDSIENKALQEMVDKLNGCNTDLQTLITQMQKASAKIAAFSNTIKSILNVTGELAQAATKAISGGFIK